MLPCAGVVCDRGLTLGHLIGVLAQFFERLGLKQLRFKPAYNPYTEPSMEIFRYSFAPCAAVQPMRKPVHRSLQHCLLMHASAWLTAPCTDTCTQPVPAR